MFLGGVGPATDHTTQSLNGRYLYLDASEGTSGKVAEILSQQYPKTPGHCLTFWYHMHGDNVGKLSVVHKGVVVWHTKGNHGDHWRLGSVTIVSDNTYQVIFGVGFIFCLFGVTE